MSANLFSKKNIILFLLLLGAVTRFLFWNHPQETVFDEYGYLNDISAYYTGGLIFDVHPPLVKLLWAGFGKITGFKPGTSGTQIKYEEMGSSFPAKEYLPLRFLSIALGALLPLVIFLLAGELGFSLRVSLAVGILLALDNGLVTQSRFILAEPFLLLFGFLSLYFYFRHRNGKDLLNLILAGILGSFAFSVKWTGASFLALVFIAETWRLLRFKEWKNLWRVFVFLVLLPLLIYFSIFALHFSFLTKNGPGNAYMSPGFNDKSLGYKFWETNRVMFTANQQDLTHPYSSKWYEWPFGLKPIYYWVSSVKSQMPMASVNASESHRTSNGVKTEARIYLLGNPAVWWPAAASILVLIFYYGLREIIKNKPLGFLFGGFLLNFLPFILIKRAMFLYHYFPALIFAVFVLVYFLDNNKNPKFILFTLILLATAGFIYFAPVTYGL